MPKWRRNLQAGIELNHRLKPLVLTDKEGRIREGDSVILCFTRSEREVEITEVFIKKGLKVKLITMTDYGEEFKDKVEVAFPAMKIKNTLSEIISNYRFKQVKITESEKEVHLSKFYNGMREEPFPGESRIIIPSPRVESFDQKPEMSIEAVTQSTIKEIQKETNRYILINFPNLDVVGHCGSDNASIRAIESVDSHLGMVVEEAKRRRMVIILTADHGSVEYSKDLHHTTNPVPFILICNSRPELREGGELADISPTQLEIWGLEKLEEMSGKSLFKDSPIHGDRILTIILDGWGIRKDVRDNLIARAHTPVMDFLKKNYSYTTLKAWGEAVGLSPKRPGNSEAGHLTIGAGRRVLSLDLRIKQAIEDGTFWENRALLSAIENVKRQNSSLHILGMISDESSHGTIEHITTLLRLAKKNGLKRVYLHGVLDRPGKIPAADLIKKIKAKITEIGEGKFMLATLVGRDIILDRSKRYERVEMAYHALVHSE